MVKNIKIKNSRVIIFKYIAKTQNWLSFKIKPNIAGLQSQNYYSPIPETSPITGMKMFI